MRAKFLRTRFLTGSKVQLRYLTLLVVSMVVPLVLVGGCLYYIIFSIMAEQLGIPESVAYHLLPVIKKINLILAMGIPPILLLLIVWGVVLSHRFAGPIERLQKEVEKISESGEYKRRIRLRRHDDIRPVAESINKLLDKIESKTR